MAAGESHRRQLQQPLLLEEKVYYEDCPGCKMALKNDTRNSTIPYKEFAYVWLAVLCAALPVSSLFPFLYFMIRDLHIAKREEDIGFYAGFVGASFMLGRALTSVFWGIVADRYGRKPIIVIGIVAVIIFNTLFGLSTSFWMAIITRFLLGSLNGILGPVKAYAIEVCSEEHHALGLSLISTAWGIGLIAGPAVGGYFAQPAERFPTIFSRGSFLGRFPYFLPCLIISIFAVIVLVACIWLPETLHMHKEDKSQYGTVESLEASSCRYNLKQRDEKAGGSPAADRSLLKNWPLLSSIFVYCIFSLHDMAYTEIFPLWAESEKKYGGLNLTTQDVGQVLAITGFSLLLFQTFIYPPINRVLGPVSLSRVASVLSIPLLASYPFMSGLSGFRLQLLVNCASLLKNILSIVIITGTFILQNNAVEQHQRGAANGLSMTAMSIFKTIAPAAGGAIFSWAQRHQNSFFLPGDHIVFFALNVVQLLAFCLTFKPFLSLPEK